MSQTVPSADVTDVVSRDQLVRVLRALFSQSRPYTAVRLGALSLLVDLLERCGEQRAADSIYRAAVPLLNAAGATGLRDVEDRLAGLSGRPPAIVSQALISDDLARAVGAGLRAFTGDERLTPCADVFATDRSSLVLAGVTEAPPSLERQMAGLLRQLWRRAGEIDRERVRAEETHTSLFATMIDTRVANGALRLLAPPYGTGKKLIIPESAAVAKSRRYGNRVAAAMGVIASLRLRDALHAGGWARALEGVAVLAAIAEAVDTTGRQRGARVPARGAPVSHAPWRTAHWLPILVAWSGETTVGTERGSTAWRLAAHESNAMVLAAGWAMSVIGGCAMVDGMRVTDDDVTSWLEVSADISWAGSAERGWDLLQSTRKPSDRAPWPLRNPASWSAWRLGSTDGLPWSQTAGEAPPVATGDIVDPAERALTDEPDHRVRVRIVGADPLDGVELTHDGTGWVMDSDPDSVASSWAELLDTVTARSGKLVTA